MPVFLFIAPSLAPPFGVSLPELHRLLVPTALYELFKTAQIMKIKIPFSNASPREALFSSAQVSFSAFLPCVFSASCCRFANVHSNRIIFNNKCCPTAYHFICHLLLKIILFFSNVRKPDKQQGTKKTHSKMKGENYGKHCTCEK